VVRDQLWHTKKDKALAVTAGILMVSGGV
jgi:hypothetical protein